VTDQLFTTEPCLELAPGGGTGLFVRVAVERAMDHPQTAEGLTYRATTSQLSIGQRVEVPLGRGNKPAPGMVVEVGGAELLGGISPAKIKPVLRALGPALPETLVALARWMSEYYICPLGMVLTTMLPAAVKRGTGLVRRLELQPASPSEAEAILSQRRLAPAAMAAWKAIGELGAIQPMLPRDLARAIAASNMGPLNRLVEAGLLHKVERQVVRGREQVWQVERLEMPGPAPALTPTQQRIVEGVSAAHSSFSVHLLRGITGSGKTEVYMQAIQRVLDRRQCALVLVPEISLTPQTAGRFITRFGSLADDASVAVLHSGMPASERHRQWSLVASGRARVVVGARSAVFAPLRELGLIVVDEEHASDYKQDQSPRYSARDVAIKRAQLEECPVLLGSATPSLESWANATGPKARYRLWELTERLAGRLPPVEVVDLAAEMRTAAHQAARAGSPREIHSIGPRLESALREALAAGGQAILLLNRRGFANYICCPDSRCGWIAGCDQCDSSLVLHKRRGGAARADLTALSPDTERPRPQVEFVRCHHCLAEQLVPRLCPVCSRKAIQLGAGTQRVEEELGRKFADVLSAEQMVRIDGDSMRSAADYFRILARFSAGDVKVLLGTQMIAKGLDFPNVRLVGVINADTGLSLPDFRAAERTFQLVTQVAGRAGRGSMGGRVIVQTLSPREPAIELAARHDYITFAQRELAIRARAGLPPACRMARIVVRDESPSRAEAHAAQIARALAPAPRCRIDGPGPCPIARIAGEYRFAIDITALRAADLARALAAVRTAGLLRSDARTAVDVDPAALL
jgi:primosomal protein N' (replication factor Y) (superfamily II helicase)